MLVRIISGKLEWPLLLKLKQMSFRFGLLKQSCFFLFSLQNLAKCGSKWILLSSYLRLCRSRSSVSKSKRGCWTSVGPWDWRTEDEEEMTVVWPEGWMVLNWNWGPIHKRRWGPVWVTISTWEYIGNGKCGEEPFIVSLTMPNHWSTLRALTLSFLTGFFAAKKKKKETRKEYKLEDRSGCTGRKNYFCTEMRNCLLVLWFSKDVSNIETFVCT